MTFMSQFDESYSLIIIIHVHKIQQDILLFVEVVHCIMVANVYSYRGLKGVALRYVVYSDLHPWVKVNLNIL